MAGANTEYEKYVQSIMQALLRAQGLDTVKVEHDVQIAGQSRSRQIDVYWEYRLGGMLHRVIINCKRYKSTVEVGDVEELGGALRDMPGVRGIIVTTVGFQRGAVDYATTHQIGLKVIRPPVAEDWEGRMKTIILTITMNHPVFLGCDVNLDHDWIKANVTNDPMSLAGKESHDSDEAIIRDLKTGIARNFTQLWNEAMRNNPSRVGEATSCSMRWDDARFELPGKPALRVNEVVLRWKIEPGQPVVHKIQAREPAAIVRDAISGTLLFVDPDGEITGDTELEFGKKRGGRLGLPRGSR